MDDADIKISGAIKTLAGDFKKNTKAVLRGVVGENVVLRSEWEARNEVLNHLAAQLDAVETRVAEIERSLPPAKSSSAAKSLPSAAAKKAKK